MTKPRFLQIHTLSPYSGALLNRDDTGLAKRLPFGGFLRTRISSQCLKRHWRLAEDPFAIEKIDGGEASFRSRELVTSKVIGPLIDSYPKDVVDAIEKEFQKAVYGDKGTTKRNRQTLLFGEPELNWLASEAERLSRIAAGDVKKAEKQSIKWSKDFKTNIRAMRESIRLPAGLTSALFGRMVTSDTKANITAPVHVAHSFTVHEEESESDYFTAVDDLSEDEPGADTIQETELNSGLFYGYVVVDLPGLISNLGGDLELAKTVLSSFIHLVAEISPGAKLGSTAPYGRSSLMLLEAGDRQPRTLAEAFRKPCDPTLESAVAALKDYLERLDAVYDTREERLAMSIEDTDLPRVTRGSLTELAEWAASLPASLA